MQVIHGVHVLLPRNAEDLAETTAVTFLACEFCLEIGRYDFLGRFHAQCTSSERDHVHGIVLDHLMCRVDVLCG